MGLYWKGYHFWASNLALGVLDVHFWHHDYYLFDDPDDRDLCGRADGQDDMGNIRTDNRSTGNRNMGIHCNNCHIRQSKQDK